MKNKKGFTLIETVVALGLAALFLPAIARLYTFAIGSSTQGDKYSKAYALAQMNIEEIYNQKKTWIWNASLNSDGKYYQRRNSVSCNSSLPLNLTDKYVDAIPDENGFISTIQIDRVPRNIVSGSIDYVTGTDNNLTKKIISKVIWSEEEDGVTISSYVTKH